MKHITLAALILAACPGALCDTPFDVTLQPDAQATNTTQTPEKQQIKKRKKWYQTAKFWAPISAVATLAALAAWYMRATKQLPADDQLEPSQESRDASAPTQQPAALEVEAPMASQLAQHARMPQVTNPKDKIKLVDSNLTDYSLLQAFHHDDWRHIITDANDFMSNVLYQELRLYDPQKTEYAKQTLENAYRSITQKHGEQKANKWRDTFYTTLLKVSKEKHLLTETQQANITDFARLMHDHLGAQEKS